MPKIIKIPKKIDRNPNFGIEKVFGSFSDLKKPKSISVKVFGFIRLG
jgi:hypothetical protein